MGTLNQMAIHPTTRVLLAVLLLSASASLAQTAPAQNPPPAAPCPAPNQPGNQNAGESAKPCPPPAPDAKKPSTSEQFPFPGEPAKPSAAPNAPSPSAPGTTPSSAATDHPFPTQLPPKLPGDDSNSSSGSSSSSADDPTPDTPTPAPGTEGSSVHRHPLPKVQHVESDDERVDEDLKVAKFYLHDENLQGAYLRAKDAVKIQPDYSATHFALAQIAQKMKKKDEAIAEYQAYLKLDPRGEKAKEAQRALEDLH
jgi:tetratricopeptide (TPR) repeat protein